MNRDCVLCVARISIVTRSLLLSNCLSNISLAFIRHEEREVSFTEIIFTLLHICYVYIPAHTYFVSVANIVFFFFLLSSILLWSVSTANVSWSQQQFAEAGYEEWLYYLMLTLRDYPNVQCRTILKNERRSDRRGRGMCDQVGIRTGSRPPELR